MCLVWGILAEVPIKMYAMIYHSRIITLTLIDQSFDKGPNPDVVGVHLSLFVSVCLYRPVIRSLLGHGSDWADASTPVAFGTRVRNALKAEPRSVKLTSLVGAGGLWYGFGKMIADM